MMLGFLIGKLRDIEGLRVIYAERLESRAEIEIYFKYQRYITSEKIDRAKEKVKNLINNTEWELNKEQDLENNVWIIYKKKDKN